MNNVFSARCDNESLYQKMREVLNNDPHPYMVYPSRSNCHAKVEHCNGQTDEIAKAAGFRYFTKSFDVKTYYTVQPVGCSYYSL